jgi:peptidoglycan/LPS O-acetylase OafA/YrhL
MSPSLSSYLNLLRFLAALAVYLFHGQHFAKFRIPYVGNLGSEAVFVFFVLSGMLITFSGMKQPDGRAFLRGRLIRLWSVCLPALALTLVADTVGQYISLAAYAPMQPYNLFKWVASLGINALFLNQVWNANVYPGTNGPFWSLSYEFWYYMIFAAGVYFSGKKKIAAVACAALIAGPAILIGLPIWLMGSVVHIAVAGNRTPGASALVGWACWLGSLAAAVAFFVFDTGRLLANAFPDIAAGAKWDVDFWPKSYLIGMFVAVNIYGFSLIGNSFRGVLDRCAQPIRFGADISFGLYLFHYPLMYLVKAILHDAGVTAGPLFVGAVYAFPFAIAAALALQCEKRKDLVGAMIDRVTSSIGARMAAPAGRFMANDAEDPLEPSPASTGMTGDDKILS